MLQWSPAHSGRETGAKQSYMQGGEYALQWSPTHSGRETNIYESHETFSSSSFNGALPIQVGKLSDTLPDMFVVYGLQWSPTHSGRETRCSCAQQSVSGGLQWSPTHSGRETSGVRVIVEAKDASFNGALPIQVGKHAATSRQWTRTERFNGALPIQVGKLVTSAAGNSTLRILLQWSPTHSGRET